MGWVCELSPSALLETLRHVFQMEKYVLVETCESPPHVGGLKQSHQMEAQMVLAQSRMWNSLVSEWEGDEDGRLVRVSPWSTAGPTTRESLIEQRLRIFVHCVNLHSHGACETISNNPVAPTV